MKTRLASALALAALSASLAACSDRAFKSAVAQERAGAYASAARRFERFASAHPKHPRAAEALVRAGRLYLYVFDRCPEAQPLFERTAREYPDSAWAEQARRALADCPEFFPLRPGSEWVFVDSQTGGRNMRLELFLRGSESKDGSSEIGGAYFAGARRFQNFHRGYVKEGWAVWETEGADRVPILRYPYRKGSSWSGRRGGKRVDFSIDEENETVQVKAGTFHGCIKVREAQAGLPAWKYDYYAPGIGRVKTTVAGARFEKPNTELESAKVPLPAAPGLAAPGIRGTGKI
ncbi:MAG: hypothetical protein NTX64_12345 [Elusimicrobia bacterium]|nr:hypothetical protein [Elusimicrobiota bacterium]